MQADVNKCEIGARPKPNRLRRAGSLKPGASAPAARRAGLIHALFAALLLFGLALGAGGASAVASTTATIGLSPRVGPPTSVIRVSGAGFAPGETIVLAFDAATVRSTTAGSSGSFSGVRARVPAKALPGRHLVTATGQTSAASAGTRFLVRTDWRQFMRTSSHRGENPFENVLSPTNVGRLHQTWASPTDFEIVDSSPAIVRGRVFIGTLDAEPFSQETGSLYSFDAATGALRWSTKLGGFALSSPAVANGIVYISSADGKLNALDANTGAIRWIKTTGTFNSSPAVSRGIVYVTSEAGSLRALDALSGATRWTADVGSSDTPTVVNGRVYVGSGTGSVFALDALTGNQLWTRDVGAHHSIYSSPVVVGWRLFVRSTNAHVYAFAAATGRRLWNVQLPGQDTSSPAATKDTLYVSLAVERDLWIHKLYALNPANGLIRWKARVGPVNSFSRFQSSPAVANGIVYQGSPSGNIYAFDAITGLRLWQASTGGPIHSSAAVADGRLYIGSIDAKVYAYALP